MTSYILDGFVTTFDDSGRITDVEQTQLVFAISQNDTGTFSYYRSYWDEDDLPFVRLNSPGINQISIPGYGLLYDDPGLYATYKLGQITWGRNTSYTFQVTDEFEQPRIFTFGLGGTPLPQISTASQARGFNERVTEGTSAPEGSGFAPGDAIEVSRFPGIRLSENDTFRARDGDTIHAGQGDDHIIVVGDNAVIDGGDGQDLAQFYSAQPQDLTIDIIEGGLRFHDRWSSYSLTNVEQVQFGNWPTLYATADLRAANLDPSQDRTGTDGADTLTGGNNNDRLITLAGDDLIQGGDGADTLNAGDGNDTILAGNTSDDTRDIVYAGAGDDHIEGGHGNDLLFGMAGNDTLLGGHGVDELQGQHGNDILSGGIWSDVLFGGDGEDFLNGGFGHDRLNGGTGGDRFYHLGIADHGSDWIQDFTPSDGDRLVFGQSGYSITDFQVNHTHTDGAGDDMIAEAFVIFRPTGQIIWALVDGGAADALGLQIDGTLFELT